MKIKVILALSCCNLLRRDKNLKQCLNFDKFQRGNKCGGEQLERLEQDSSFSLEVEICLARTGLNLFMDPPDRIKVDRSRSSGPNSKVNIKYSKERKLWRKISLVSFISHKTIFRFRNLRQETWCMMLVLVTTAGEWWMSCVVNGVLWVVQFNLHETNSVAFFVGVSVSLQDLVHHRSKTKQF